MNISKVIKVISQKLVYLGKNCSNPPFLSYKIVTYTKKKQIAIFRSFIIVKIMCYMLSHFASLRMLTTQTHRKLLPKWLSYVQRNLIPHIASPQVAAAHRKSCFANQIFLTEILTYHRYLFCIVKYCSSRFSCSKYSGPKIAHHFKSKRPFIWNNWRRTGNRNNSIWMCNLKVINEI